MSARRNRLDRIICRQLGISQDAVRPLLAQQRVRVDGKLVQDRDLLVSGFNVVTVDERHVHGASPVYLMLHKPAGVLSATRDARHPVATSLIEHPAREQLHIAGRLDLHSSGLLLLSNDGRWTRLLSEPQRNIAKQYLVSVKHPIDAQCADAFRAGMHFPFENITTRPAELEILSARQARVTLYEGRYHQIKRMFGRFRNPVLTIHRYAIGELQLDDTLPAGSWRQLSSEQAWQVAGEDLALG